VDKFVGVEWSPAASGAPVLDGLSAWVGCTLWAEYDGGDHSIVAGRVEALGSDPDRLPLLFFRGGYYLTPRINAWQHSEEAQRSRFID
jgi:3-hydroxy-9,10-secoandrosta-1,3,5(10)-triene-9,17-dione monooxygenase reductase component